MDQLNIELHELKNYNYRLDTTLYQLEEYKINDSNLYEKINFDKLKVGNRYRYYNKNYIFPIPVTILFNQGDILIITNPYFHGKEFVIKKSLIKLDTEFFYKKIEV